jgi:nitroreductase
MADHDQATWAAVAGTIRARRSNLNVDPERPVAREVIDELIELANWAPNHWRTNPVRYVVVTGAARARLGELAASLVAKRPNVQEAMVERQRGQFVRAPVVLIVASIPDADRIKNFENTYTVAAAVQNLMLGATAAGLASAWRSGAAMTDADVSPEIKKAVGLDPADEIVAFVYLGHPIQPPGTREKPEAHVHYVDA